MTSQEIIAAFHRLYAGDLAQQYRDAGDEKAMPPWAETYWLGRQVVKCPMDLWTYQEIIWETKPDLLIETGTSGGGSAYFFATIMDRIGKGKVITVDTVAYPELWSAHERIQYFTGDSVSDEAGDFIRVVAGGLRVMVSLDSSHTYEHVKRELELYAPMVSPGCYCVVEDTGFCDPTKANEERYWADDAVAEFLRDNQHFETDRSREKHLLTSNRGGWLRRKT